MMTRVYLMSREANEIEFLLRGLNRQMSLTEMDDQPWRSGSLTGVLLATPPASAASIRAFIQKQSSPEAQNLPAKHCCDFLFETYVWNYHAIVPLVHEPSFRIEYERYWELKSGSSEKNATAATPLVLAALWAGTVICTQSDWDLHCATYEREEAMLKLYWMAFRALRISNFPRLPTVETLSAYIVLQSTSMREEEPLSTASFVGVIVRVAQMLGLNREPSLFQASLSTTAAEVRRRVWWHVFRIDVLVALASGLPPLIDRDSWDVRMLSEVRDELLGTVAALQYEEKLREGSCQPQKVLDPDSMVSPASIFARGKIEDTLFARELLNKTFGPKPMTSDDLKSTQQELERFQERILKTAKRITISTATEAYENNNELNAWAKLVLWAMGDRYWWYMHSPVLNRAISRAWSNLLPRVIHNCRSFLLKYICLAACHEFQRWHWSWPGNHQPLHAIILLLKEVERDPDGVNAQSSRSIIDQAISLCGPDGGISGAQGDHIVPRALLDGGQEAWNLITRLRLRAWIKAGLNPDTLPTRAQVVQLAQMQLIQLRSEVESGITPQMNWPGLELQDLEVSPEFDDPLSSNDTFSPNVNWQDWDAMFGNIE
ncbi:uncharacterized protein BDZ99DRAFT_273857 [Mytilinidion resinicola]|uniref:Xylanolytic transcriptional activator regulatory domain-containing protein n=1 Tax=Mytilinidion resinicola TaxID=574789 RepID=A0A6A6YTV2_9PEZI|nr:uncharacterized protein BDZ99DRAFT_273857 [Mytilinidion resinicola]KAF2811337.1 hypothetical protein BDZ99DRAFT_273857 [Mytilinidion resinicola]